jgi:hypothetical protein
MKKSKSQKGSKPRYKAGAELTGAIKSKPDPNKKAKARSGLSHKII